VGGRITPSFTAGALRQRPGAPEVVIHPGVERAAILSTLGVALADLFSLPTALMGALAVLAGALNALRLAGYRPRFTIGQPLLWVLHLGYAWAAMGLALKGLAAFVPALPSTAALHALTVGAIGTMTLAVMSRAALGHTGRPLVAPPPMAFAYGLVSAAALVRVLTPLLAPALYLDGILVSGVLWVLAFTLYVAVYAPVLTRSRVDGQPG